MKQGTIHISEVFLIKMLSAFPAHSILRGKKSIGIVKNSFWIEVWNSDSNFHSNCILPISNNVSISGKIFAPKILWGVTIPFRFHVRSWLFSVMLMTIFVGREGMGSGEAMIILFAFQNCQNFSEKNFSSFLQPFLLPKFHCVVSAFLLGFMLDFNFFLSCLWLFLWASKELAVKVR